MATEKLTEYERKRLENIKRNDQMMAALKLHSKASQLAASSKRRKIENQIKTCGVRTYKKPAPVVIRRSLRARGMPPDSKGLKDDFDDAVPRALESKPRFSKPRFSPRNVGSFSMGDASCGRTSPDAFVRVIRRFSNKAEIGGSGKEESGGVKACKDEILRNSDTGVTAHSVGCGDIKAEGSLGLIGSLTPQLKDSLGRRLKREGIKTEYSSEFISTLKMADSLGYGIKRECLDDSSECISSLTPQVEDSLGSGLKREGINTEDSSKFISTLKMEDSLGYGIKRECLDDSLECIRSLTLEEENVSRVVPGRIMVVKFFPTTELRMVAIGNKDGNVGFWNMDPEKDEGDGKHLYRPHSAPVGGISIQPFNIGKIFTCCYDGFVRMMDVEKERFDLVHASDDAIFSLSRQPNDGSCLYFGEGCGGLNIWDLRVGKSTALWALHEDRINTIDFKPQDCFVFATSSSDGTACIWDLRRMGAKNLKSLKVIEHERSVQSAYFSPSGSCLATTSFDDTICIASGDSFEKTSHVFHNNQTGRWISSFRAIWGWDDSYIFIGNMKRAVDVICPTQSKIVMSLQSPRVSAIQCRFDAHPLQVGVLAGATAGGQVYIWTSP